MGMAVFSDVFIEEFGLTRTQLSTAYFLGTVGSALLLPRAGRWYDQYGARFMLVAACVMLGATIAFISVIDYLGTWFVATVPLQALWITFPLILLGYFGVRFSGQGVLTSASRNVLLVWFEKRRGLVSGIRGVFVSLGFSLAPLLLALLIDEYGWRSALWILGAAVGIGFALVSLLTVRNHPSVAGLSVDGVSPNEPVKQKGHVEDRTAAQAKRDPVFWLYSLSLSMHALFGTAVTFHIVAIFSAANRSATEAFAYFLPQAIVSVSVNLAASAMADYMRLKPLLILMLVMFLVGTWGIANLHTELGYWGLVVGLVQVVGSGELFLTSHLFGSLVHSISAKSVASILQSQYSQVRLVPSPFRSRMIFQDRLRQPLMHAVPGSQFFCCYRWLFRNPLTGDPKKP